MLLAIEFRASRPKEVVVVIGDDPGQAKPVLEQLRSLFLPHKVVVIVSHGTDREALARRVPPAKGKLAREGKTTAYVCEHGVCLLPTTDPRTLAKQLTAPVTSSHAGSAAPGQSAADTEKNRVKRIIDD
jgi:uncharacterized protein YyaL (SSP411 family)